jgi:hypothetical protein
MRAPARSSSSRFRLAERGQPTGDRPPTREPPESGKPLDERIAAQILDVPEPAPTHQQHRHHEQDHRCEAKVASAGEPAFTVPQVARQAALSQVPADQLEAGVRAQSLVPEHDPQVALDPRRETALSYPHWKWSFVREVFMVSQPENITTGRPLPVFSAPHRRAECPFRANPKGTFYAA